jgi:hypothetical protein
MFTSEIILTLSAFIKNSKHRTPVRIRMRPRWFRTLYGFDENLSRCRENLSVIRNECGIQMLLSSQNSKLFRIGEFATPTVEELKNKALESLNEINFHRDPGTYSHCVVGDVLEMHHQHPRATFQAASQLNCLEFAQPNATPEHGVSIYAHDHTQGPACALACASGTIFRNYFATPSTNPPGVIGQSADSQFNNLDELERFLDNSTHHYWSVKNGYTNSTRDGLELLNQILSTLPSEDLVKMIKVGVHDDVGIDFSSRWTPIEDRKDDLYVTQVYCSAISCAYTSLPTSLWQPLAELVLQAQYEATIWAAVLNHHRGGTNTLFLTFVGGGVYGNENIWIGRSIARALGVATKYNCGLDIRICHYGRINEQIREIIDCAYEQEIQR